MGKKNKKKTVAGRLERAGADGEGEKKKRERLMEKDRALEEGGEMLNRCGGGGGRRLSGSQRGIDMVGTGESGDLHFI